MEGRPEESEVERVQGEEEGRSKKKKRKEGREERERAENGEDKGKGEEMKSSFSPFVFSSPSSYLNISNYLFFITPSLILYHMTIHHATYLSCHLPVFPLRMLSLSHGSLPLAGTQ